MTPVADRRPAAGFSRPQAEPVEETGSNRSAASEGSGAAQGRLHYSAALASTAETNVRLLTASTSPRWIHPSCTRRFQMILDADLPSHYQSTNRLLMALCCRLLGPDTRVLKLDSFEPC